MSFSVLESPRLPERYRTDWKAPFDARVGAHLAEGCTVLDLGGGASPAIPPEGRPAGCRYVGLDVSAAELSRAPAGAYDERFVADASNFVAALQGRVDVVVSWQALEHVRRLEDVVRNCHVYLRPGGALVALCSGTFAFFALAGRIVPHRLAKVALGRLVARDPDSVFPAHYDRTWYSALERCFGDGWAELEIVPLYRGAGYLHFAPPLQRLYLRYENWAARTGRRNLATHYLVRAVKEPGTP